MRNNKTIIQKNKQRKHKTIQKNMNKLFIVLALTLVLVSARNHRFNGRSNDEEHQNLTEEQRELLKEKF